MPENLGDFVALRDLVLAGNDLAELPTDIAALGSLERLDLTDNKITLIGPAIGKLGALQWLHLGGNRLGSLPAEIGQISGLRWLYLDGNDLTELPREISVLAHLVRLRVSGNRLGRLPREVGLLANLEELDLSRNNLTSLPQEIGNLKNLRRLLIGGNQISEIPSTIGQLTRLRVLDLAGNQVASLPTEIGNLRHLKVLRLDENELGGLPSEVCTLSSLEQLTVRNNMLTKLPTDIGNLPRLNRLSVDHNRLTSLPGSLARLVESGNAEFAGNPLAEPLPELIERGSRSLVTYLESLNDALPNFEAKLLLVGEGNVGKTSLVASLLGDPFVSDRNTTHGIEIHVLKLPHPRLGHEMTLRAWDFGGQEVYRITHQFFFSRRALYLVVWHAREGQEQNEVEGWLRRIRLRIGSEARAIVVTTHSDERIPELDYPQLQREFPGILAGHYSVDNKSNDGIERLREALAAEAAVLPQMGQLISPRWIAARDAILALADDEPQIAYSRFARVCKAHGIRDKEVRPLVDLLHDLGQIVYYGDDEGLRDVVVLNPEWLTKAIGYVLEDRVTRHNDGVLDHFRLREIWGDRAEGAGYPVAYHPYFLRLMEKFDVSYRLEDDESRSLVAQLVPYEKPPLPWERGSPVQPGVRSISMICRLREPAPGLIAWLTVRHHHASAGMHWRSGVFLRHPIKGYASEALLETRSDGLMIEIRAPSPDLYFNVVRDSVEHLIRKRWPGLEYQLLIPCPGSAEAPGTCTQLFPLDGLIDYRERGGTVQNCLECQTDHHVAELLTGFALPTELTPGIERLERTVAKVAEGVLRIERAAADTANSMRRVFKALATEVTDCPRLFTIVPRIPTFWQRVRFFERRYDLTLWCEQPGTWHPWMPATYEIQQPRDWLISVAPYANLTLKVLRLVVPVGSAVIGVEMSKEQFEQASHQLELMKVLVDSLPERIGREAEGVRSEGLPSDGLSRAEGRALRGLRALVFQQDWARSFGGLRRVQDPSGDYLWVCSQHYPEYDPGLPVMPDPTG